MTAFPSAPDASVRSTSAPSNAAAFDAAESTTAEFDAAAFDAAESTTAAFDAAEFDMLLRAVELVALSQAFSPLGLQRALRLTSQLTGRLTIAMQLIGVISPTASGHSGTVLIGPEALPVLLPQLRSQWRDSRMSNAA